MRRRRDGETFRARPRAVVALRAAAALLTRREAGAVTMFGVAAGAGTGSAVSHTLDGIASKTFTASEPKVRRATRTALRKMDLKVQPAEPSQNGAAPSLIAAGKDRQMEIELEPISPQATRIRVMAKDGIFFKDKATASEIIYQVADAPEGRG